MTESAILPRMDPRDAQRIHRAAFYVTRLYPGPMGELASREITAYAEFGYRLGVDATVVRLTAQVLEEWAQREGRVA